MTVTIEHVRVLCPDCGSSKIKSTGTDKQHFQSGLIYRYYHCQCGFKFRTREKVIKMVKNSNQEKYSR